LYDLLRSAERIAIHLETRDSYTPDDPDWNDWKSGRRFDPAERWRDWFELMRDITGRGIEVRRARIVSEPVSEYIQFEYDVTAAHNIAAGELVRWLPRHQSTGVTVPPADFWVVDEKIVIWNHFSGDGSWVTEERATDPELAMMCTASFEAVWKRAIPHEVYRPS
jgi:hypothetical protein